ncbi:MAG: DUF4178 domain-containing protein [Bryobacteraceae bacterium]
MSSRISNCPSCGAPVEFVWSGAVQTVCSFCRSILVRDDLDLRKVGEVADLPPDSSPIQIRTEGIYKNKAFVIVGRILYEYEQGGWNEWHAVFNDGTSGWIADAQLEYDVSFAVASAQAIPPSGDAYRGKQYVFENTPFQVTSRTEAHYCGVEGELPFQYWDKSDVVFADLRSRDGKFGTIDYTEEPPLLYLGEPVEFEDLHFKNLRQFEGWT